MGGDQSFIIQEVRVHLLHFIEGLVVEEVGQAL